MGLGGTFKKIKNQASGGGWINDGLKYAGLVVGGGALGATGSLAGGVMAAQDYQGNAVQRQNDRIRGAYARAASRAKALEPKGVDPKDAIARRRQRLSAAYGRSQTILTSPQGLIGLSTGGGRMLIGS